MNATARRSRRVPRRPRVLIVAPWAPYPYDGGSKRILTLARLLSDRFRFRLLTVEPASRSPGEVAADLALERRHLAPIFESVERVAVGAPRPDEGLPEDVARWNLPQLAWAARRLARRAEIVHAEYELAAPAVMSIRGRARVVTLHDMGEFRREDLTGARQARRERALRRATFLRRVCAEFDRAIVMTEPDRRRLARLAEGARAVAIPTGVDLEEFPLRAAEPTGEPTVAFVGHYPHYPNEDAVAWFLREAWPIVRAARPDARFLAIGSSPTPAVLAAVAAAPAARATGTVESVAEHLARASVFVAPVRLGAGIKGKLLEAFSLGVPAAATPTAARGLGARDGRELSVSASAPGLAAAVLELLSSEPLRRRRALAARRFVERRFDWRACAGRLGDEYERVLEERSRGARRRH